MNPLWLLAGLALMGKKKTRSSPPSPPRPGNPTNMVVRDDYLDRL